jgi:hypothetical protein
MNIKNLLFYTILFFGSGSIFAQQGVISKPTGTPIPDYLIDNSNIQVIEDKEDYILFYQDCDWTSNKSGTNKLIAYSPDSKTAQITELIIPNGNNYITSKVVNNEVLNFYFFHNIKSRTIELHTANVAIPESNFDSQKLTMNTLFSYQIEPKTTTKGFFAESLDKKYFSLILTTLDERKSIKTVFVIVYNEKFEIDWMQEFKPDFALKQTDIADVKVTNNGKALILLNTYDAVKKKQSNHELQLLSFYKDNDLAKFKTVTPFGIIQSMKMLVLKNGHYFVAGYYSEKQNATTAGYFTYTFDPRKEKEVLTSYNYKFNESYKERDATGFAIPAKPNTNYDLKCDYLWELPNDFIVMLGEQFLETTTVDPKKKTTTYNYFFKNVFYHKFALDGTHAGYDMFPKPQFGTSLTPINDYSQLGLSYSAFLNGTTVYLIYNEHISRFDKKGFSQFVSFNSDFKKEACLTLLKINKIGDVGGILILAPTKDLYYNKLWYSDGWNLVFGLSSKKMYSLEQLQIQSDWQWD